MGSFAKGTSEPEDGPRRSPGDHIALREIWRGRIWTARPSIVVEDTPEGVMCYSPHGNRFRAPVTGDGTPLRVYAEDWGLVEDVWNGPNVLSFAFPSIPYAVLLFFDPTSGVLDSYYVNLESPLARTEIGFDYVEHLLDVQIAPDRSSWSWKDEDELAEAVRRGLFSSEDAAWFRHWGARAVEHVLLGEPPFDRDWSAWRPDPSWGTPTLPAGWDRAPLGRGVPRGDVLGRTDPRA